jgi:homoserine dehydrogenase
MHTKKIMKFGGTSLAGADCFRRVEGIIRASMTLNPIIVVSAPGAEGREIKITDSLKDAASALLEGSNAAELLGKVHRRFQKMTEELGLSPDLLEADIADLEVVVGRIKDRAFSTAEEALDALMGFGEIFSAKIMASYLTKRGLSFTVARPEEFDLITDHNSGNATILESSLEKIAARVISSKDHLVVPGFIGVTKDGRRTTLGRGGSDYTAAILGAALKRDVEIWTDVDGIYRIHPKYMPEQFRQAGHPETIPELSYEEAFQMAAFGSKVLFEKAMDAVQQAVRKGKHIRLLIKNTFNPDHAGTIISSTQKNIGVPRGITCLEGTHLFNCYPRTPDGAAECAHEIRGIEKCTVLLSSETLGRLSFVLDKYDKRLTDLESKYQGHLSRDQVLVKIVGDGLGENSQTLSRIQAALQSAENPEKYRMTVVHKSPQLLTDTTFEFLVKKRGLQDVLLILYKDLFMEKTVTIGMMGMGTVGKGVVDYTKTMYSAEKGGFTINFPRALVLDGSKERGNLPMQITTDAAEIINDPTVNIILEVMGGLEPAKTYILEALKQGKDVVTANKALLAECGIEIFQAAHKYRRNIGFEASVCGEIPIIDDLLKFPGIGDVEGIEGIVNGTSNYVLTRFMEGMSIDHAITLAQDRGFAEADPFMDISGLDAAQKLAILASILFNQPLNYKDIPRQGLLDLLPVDRLAFNNWKIVVKPLAMARLVKDKLILRVSPALVPLSHPLAAVRDENNALALYLLGRAEPITNIGKGAGAIPTARSILRDILDVSRRSRAHMVSLPEFFRAKKLRQIGHPNEFRGNWYVRLTVLDEPGVFGAIATIFGEHKLSIKRVIQEEFPEELGANILLEMKNSALGDLEKALKEISDASFVKQYFYCLMI